MQKRIKNLWDKQMKGGEKPNNCKNQQHGCEKLLYTTGVISESSQACFVYPRKSCPASKVLVIATSMSVQSVSDHRNPMTRLCFAISSHTEQCCSKTGRTAGPQTKRPVGPDCQHISERLVEEVVQEMSSNSLVKGSLSKTCRVALTVQVLGEDHRRHQVHAARDSSEMYHSP